MAAAQTKGHEEGNSEYYTIIIPVVNCHELRYCCIQQKPLDYMADFRERRHEAGVRIYLCSTSPQPYLVVLGVILYYF